MATSEYSLDISDHTEPGQSTILVVPGSYTWSREQRATFEEWLDPADIVAVKVPTGSVMLVAADPAAQRDAQPVIDRAQGDTVPLKAWAEARHSAPPYDWGTGLSVSHTKGPGFAFTQATVPDGTSGGSS